MSQNQLFKPTQSEMLFSLNIRGVSQLFPGFAEGDFALIQGSSSILSLTSLLCVRAQLPTQLGGLQSNVVFIDGGNTFRLYQIAQLAQMCQLSPKQVLDKIYISRAFTAYQVTALIMQKLKSTIKKFNSKCVVISDIAGLFFDKDLPEYEARAVFSQVTAYLSNFAKENRIVLIATYLPHPNNKRSTCLQSSAQNRANVVLSLSQTPYARQICLEKHLYLKTGTVELPDGNTKLTDFLGDVA